jgi:hypothetical protein
MSGEYTSEFYLYKRLELEIEFMITVNCKLAERKLEENNGYVLIRARLREEEKCRHASMRE